MKYVVFDEFHFFCADSVFNEKCDYLLKLATSKFCKAIRIYMSATTEDVLDPLAKAELNNYHRICYPYPSRPLLPAYHYYRHADYDGYDLRFFDDLDELCPEIENDASVRWLIFVSSKEDGKNLAAKLGTNAYYIDAAKKEGPVWDKLMDDHCFDTQVLISTPVLDCGFNLIDDTLTNVVIATDNKTSFMQMLGRKRRTNDAPVTVWVQDISKRTIAARHNQFQNILRWYKDFDRCRTPEQRLKFAANLWRSYDPSIQKLFRLTVNDLYLNELARYTIKRRALFYSQLLSGSITFQEEVRRWLGHSLVPRQDSNVVLEQFYLEHEGVPLSEQEQNQLRQLIVQLSEQQGFSEPQKKRCDSLGERALNNRLNNIAAPFKIFTTDDSHWLLKRI